MKRSPRAFWIKRLWAVLALALRNTVRQQRSLMGLGIVVLGTAATILAGGFIEDTVLELGESLIHSQSGHLQVSVKGFHDEGFNDPEKYLIEDSDRISRVLDTHRQVKEVLSRVVFSGLLGNGRSDTPIFGEGVEPDKEAALSSYMTISDGRQLRDDDIDGVLLGDGVARALRLKVGDRAVLLATTADGAINTADLQVVGIFKTFMKEYDARAIRIPIGAAQDLSGRSGMHTFVLSLEQTAKTDTVADWAQQAIGPTFEVKTWQELNDFYRDTKRFYDQLFAFLLAIMLLLIVLSVSTTISMNVVQRSSEFGTMAVLGTRSGGIFGLVVVEGFLLGLIGGLAGAGLGLLLAQTVSAIGIPMPPPPNSDLEYVSRIVVTFEAVVLAVLLAVVAASLASILPARRVATMRIAQALRTGV